MEGKEFQGFLVFLKHAKMECRFSGQQFHRADWLKFWYDLDGLDKESYITGEAWNYTRAL